MELLAELNDVARLQLQLDFAPKQVWITGEVPVRDFSHGFQQKCRVENALRVHVHIFWRLVSRLRRLRVPADVLQVGAGAARRAVIVAVVWVLRRLFLLFGWELLGPHVRLAFYGGQQLLF